MQVCAFHDQGTAAVEAACDECARSEVQAAFYGL
jgi:hypothetical protein